MMDWLWGLIGGLMIGSAAALFLLGNGRVMGASGLLGGLIDRSARGDEAERLVFLAGLIGVPVVIVLAGATMDTQATTNPLLLIAGGLAVGVGTRIANGCTSGHGVCGISRLSPRGIVATLCYIGAGAVTVAVMNVIGGAA